MLLEHGVNVSEPRNFRRLTCDKLMVLSGRADVSLLHSIQALLYLMGIPAAVPFLEVVSYAGYPFVHVCLASLAGAAFGALPPQPVLRVLRHVTLGRSRRCPSAVTPCWLTVPFEFDRTAHSMIFVLTVNVVVGRAGGMACAVVLWRAVHGHLHSAHHQARHLS